MPWKKDDKGAYVEDEKGNPIFKLESGEERSVDYLAMSKALTDASRESATRKEQIRNLETAAKLWGDIQDIPGFISQAKKDAEAVKSMSDKEKDAEEAARARVLAATGPLEKKIADLEADKAKIIGQFHTSMICGQFGTSKYVADELVSAAIAQELFAKNFSVDENGSIVGKDSAGNVIYDESGPAGFDVALRKIVSASPHRAFIVKGSDKSGSGATPTGQNNGRQNNLENMSSVEKIAAGLRKRNGSFGR